MTSRGSLSTSRRAVAVQWEQRVLESVSRGSCHAGYASCSKNFIYLEPRYGIEP